MSELNPLGLWPGQERGGLEERAEVGAQGKVEVGSQGTRGSMGLSRTLEGQAGQSWDKREGLGGLGEPRKVRGPQTPLGLTRQLPIVQFEAAEWVGAVEEHMPLRVHRLQLLQGGLPAPETLRKGPQSS